MSYNLCPVNDDFDNDIIHSALILEWNSLSKQIESSTDLNNIRFYCKQLIRVLDMIEQMENVGF